MSCPGVAHARQGGRVSDSKELVISVARGVFRFPAPPPSTTKAARGSGTAKRRARRSRGRCSYPGARGRVPRGSSGPATGAPLAASARRAKVPGPAARVRAGRAPAYRDVCRPIETERQGAKPATTRFGFRDGDYSGKGGAAVENGSTNRSDNSGENERAETNRSRRV